MYVYVVKKHMPHGGFMKLNHRHNGKLDTIKAN